MVVDWHVSGGLEDELDEDGKRIPDEDDITDTIHLPSNVAITHASSVVDPNDASGGGQSLASKIQILGENSVLTSKPYHM